MNALRPLRTALSSSHSPTTTIGKRFLANTSMATASQIHLGAAETGLWKVKQTEETAKTVSRLLQEDLEKHHVFFNQDGFHNHITHHLLSLFGTGASLRAVQKGYDDNASYQRSTLPLHEHVPEDLSDWTHARKYLGKEKHYPDFLAFFQREIDRLGWEATINEYVFKGDERADDMLVRLFGGFLHPLIQLMYGLEWKQPAIIAEGLAQACVHGIDLRDFLLSSEKGAAAEANPMPNINSLYEAVHGDPALAGAAHSEDGNKVRDGVLKRARDEMVAVASRVKVQPHELERRTVEMYNNCVAVAAAAAFHPPKRIKFDFFLMHHVNSAPIFLTINSLPSIPEAAKVRILEWKIRMDLLQYAARACPPLALDPISAYTPAGASKDTETEALAILAPLHEMEDDGHAIKLARAAAIGEMVSKPLGDDTALPIRGPEMWRKIHQMVVDSVQGHGAKWVRTAGLDDAWKDVEDQAKL